MATATLRPAIHTETKRKESLMTKLMNSYMNLPKRDRASILCGFLAMNGHTNVYPLYKSLTE